MPLSKNSPLINQNLLSLTVQSFFSTWAIMRAGNITTRSILSPILFLFCIFFFHFTSDLICKDGSKSLRLSSVLLGSLFTVFFLLAKSSALTGALNNRMFQLIILIACAAGFFFLFGYLLFFLFYYLKKYRLTEESTPLRFLPLVSFLFCFLCRLPYFLYEFPGIMTPDSINQFEQVLGLVPYSNHHPFVHTLLIGFFYRIGRLFTSDISAAVSVFTLFQMLFMSFTAAYLIATLQRLRIKNIWCLIVLAFYALIPYHSVFAVTIWKDVLFSGAVLLFSTALVRLLFLRGQRLALILYVLSGLMMCLFRSNGWYAFLFSLPFLIFCFRQRLKLMLPIHLAIIFLALIIKIPVMNVCGVTQPDFVESICIPLQQVSRVICEDKTLTEEEWASVRKVMDTTYIKELYAPGFADNMKELVRAGNPDYLADHKAEYFKLWLSLGVRYPGAYLQAHIDQTIGYWFPDVEYTVADIDGVIANDTGVASRSLIGGPLVVKTKEILLKLPDLLPLYGLVNSMGFFFWLLLFLIASAAVKGEYRNLILYLPGLAVILTLFIATPVSSEFRYAYSLAYTMPLYCFVPFLNRSVSERS